MALYINNEEPLYRRAYDLARKHGEAKAAVQLARELQGAKTPDGAVYNLACIRDAIRDIAS